ncbi:MAG: hypothetical protein LBU99_01650, partial [Spirochaetaceae bacterium]|nr:hypothetical protein [Spirochaetaceae bacterium]
RIALNLSFAKHFSIFGGVGVDLIIEGYNDHFPVRNGNGKTSAAVSGRALTSFEVSGTNCSLYPTFFAGLKF